MDNELHYLTYDPDEIWNAMMVNYIEAGGDVLYPGDEKEMLLRSVLADVVQAFSGVDNALRMQTLRYAVGNYLDIIGENRGCERLQGDYAKVDIKITTRETGRSTILAAGTAMTSDGNIYYVLDSDILIDGTEAELTATATCEKIGSLGNGILKGTVLDLIVPNSSIKNIVTTSNAHGGENREDDESYRSRIHEHGLASVTTGPARQYKELSMSVSSDIIDAAVLSNAPGAVNVYLLLKDMDNTELISEVLKTLSSDDTRPLTDNVNVELAQKLDYVIKVEYTSDISINDEAIRNAVSNYIEWQNKTIGIAFNPDKLMALMYQAGASRVTWKDGSFFNGSAQIEYTEIEKYQYCNGTVELIKA